MSGFERKLSIDGQRLKEAAAKVLWVTDLVMDREELLVRLSGTTWRLGEDHHGVELLTTRGSFFVQIFVEIGVGVTVRRWRDEAQVLPAQKDQWESSISVYPKYESGDPIFDDLRGCGLASGMNIQDTAEILTEMARILMTDV